MILKDIQIEQIQTTNDFCNPSKSVPESLHKVNLHAAIAMLNRKNVVEVFNYSFQKSIFIKFDTTNSISLSHEFPNESNVKSKHNISKALHGIQHLQFPNKVIE
jgi:hypothetical protein